MKKQYNVLTVVREAKARSKRLREIGISGGSINVNMSTSPDRGDGHVHENLLTLDRMSVDGDNYLRLKTSVLDDNSGTVVNIDEKAKAGYADEAFHAVETDHAEEAKHADVAYDLDKDSPVNERFLRKDCADSTNYLLEANAGLIIRSYQTLDRLNTIYADSLIEENDAASLSMDVIEENATTGISTSLLEVAVDRSNGTFGTLSNISDSVDNVSNFIEMIVKLPGSTKWTVDTTLFANVASLMSEVFPFIFNFSGGGIFEKGSSQIVKLAWNYDRDIESQRLDGQSMDVIIRSAYMKNVTSDSLYTLSVVCGGRTYTKSVSALFQLKKYYGVSENGILTNDEILALSSAWAARSQNPTLFDCTGGRYPYYILPAAMASGIQFLIGGLRNTDWNEEMRTVTNTHGYAESYIIFRLNHIQTGVLNIEVK